MWKKTAKQLKEGAIIAPSVSITGEVTGDEDLTIQGRVEGKIDLKKNNVTVDKKGRIVADIYGNRITVEGEVQGNLFGEERIALRKSGVVRGNMTAPRVKIEDGAKFQGTIDMDSKSEVLIRSSSKPFEMKPSSPQKQEPKKDTPQRTGKRSHMKDGKGLSVVG